MRSSDQPADDGTRGRILMVTSTFPRWKGDSTAPFVLHLAQDLQALSWQVDVLAPHAAGAARSEILDGVPVERFRYLWPESAETLCYEGGALINLRKRPHNCFKLPPFALAEWAGVLRRLSGGRYDLVHSHWILPQGFTTALAAAPLGVPHVLTVHGSDIFALQGRLLGIAKRFALRHADRVTVNSTATAAAVRMLCPDVGTLRQIPMGITEASPSDAEVSALRRRYRRGEGPLVCFVGRLIEQKGVADLIRAIANLSQRCPDVTAVIVGDGPDRASFESLAKVLGVADRTFFCGWVEASRVFAYLKAADIFAGPSRRSPNGSIEAQGLTFLEALLVGTPVVATALGGIMDAIRHEETGLLVPEAAPEALAEAIARLAADTALARRLVETGGKLVRRRFTRSISASAFSETFDGLLRGKASAVYALS